MVGGSDHGDRQQSVTTGYSPRHRGLARGLRSQSLQERAGVPMTVNLIKQVWPARCFDLAVELVTRPAHLLDRRLLLLPLSHSSPTTSRGFRISRTGYPCFKFTALKA
jgi:hypothetical protein